MRRASGFASFLTFSFALVVLLFSDAFVHGRVLSQADILYLHAPWSGHVPAGFTRPGNDLLSDIPQVFYPFLSETAASLKAGRLPTWTTAIFGGHPFLASFQTATFSIFTLPALALPPAEALLAAAFLRLLVGAVGMWLFLRRLGLSPPAVWFGSIAWLLNPFSVVWVEHPVANVSAWLPFLFWSADRLLTMRTARDVGLLSLIVGVVILAGHPETSYKVLLFGGAYVVTGLAVDAAGGAGAGQAWRDLAWRFAPAGILGLLLSAIQVLPFAEYLTQSFVWEYRRDAAANIFPAPLATVITAVVPNFFGNPSKGLYLYLPNAYGILSNFNEQLLYPGIATWILAAVGVVSAGRSWRVRFFALSAVIAALLMYGVPGFVHALMLVPGASVIILTRFGLVTMAGAIVVATYGVDALARRDLPASLRARPAVIAAVAMGLAVAVGLVWARSLLTTNGIYGATLAWSAAALVMAAAAAAAVALRVRGQLGAGAFAFLAIACLTADLFALAWRFHPMIPREQLFASTPEIDAVRADRGLFRVAGLGTALLPNSAMAYGLQDLRGYDGMQPNVHGEIAGISHKGGAYRVIKETETFHVLDLMNVKYVFARANEHLPSPHFTRLDTGGGAAVFRNERAFPRAFLVDRVRVSTRAEALPLIRSDAVDLRREALLYEALPPSEAPERAEPGAEGSARVTRYENTHVEIETDATGRRVLIFGDLDYPGWKATVNGAPARILRADRGLRAVALPAGRNLVVFTFEPQSVRIGAWLSLAALAATVYLIAMPIPRRLAGSLLIVLLAANAASAQAPAPASSNPQQWEKEIQAFEAADKTSPPPQNGIVFIGSSSIRLWKTLAQDFPGLPVVNRGFGGSQLPDSTYFAARIVAPYKPRLIVMYAGGNDINAGRSPEQVFADYRTFVETVRTSLPSTRIAYISIAGNPARWAQVDRVRKANQLIEAYTKQAPNLAFIDIFPAMLDASGQPRPELFVEDRLHMNPNGYAIWTKIVGPYLK